jgi:hypothetical protein
LTILQEKLESMLGPVLAYDGRYLIWARSTHPEMIRQVYDLRDIQTRLGIRVTLDELRGALPKFDPPKRRRSTSVAPEESNLVEDDICEISEE